MDVRSDRGALMQAEIGEQPEVLSRLLDQGSAPIRAVAAAVAARRPRFVVLAGRGTSDHAAHYAKYLVETRLALPAGLASPSTLTQYGARPDLTDVCSCSPWPCRWRVATTPTPRAVWRS